MLFVVMNASRLFAAALLVAGCGKVSETPDPIDASPDSDPVVDAPPAACDLGKPFADLHPLANVNTDTDEDGVSLTNDELTLILSSNRNAPGTSDFDIFIATRASTSEDFGTPVPIAVVNSGGDQRGPAISGDGKTLLFHDSATGGYDLYISTRDAAGFTAPVILVGTNLNTAAIESTPSLSDEAMYFGRDDGGKLLRASRGVAGFNAAEEITGLVAPGRAIGEPTPSADDQTLFFSSDRAGIAGLVDVFVAKRPTPGAPFGTPTLLPELVSGTDQTRIDWISVDGCRVYFWTIRAGGPGKFDIWIGTRPN